MFNLGANPKVRGSGHLVLNFLRALNLIGLLGGAFASVGMIVQSALKFDIWFFDILAHLFIFTLCTFLFISELGLCRGYFERNWPVFSSDHSFFWLGMLMIAVGTQVLSNLDKPKYAVAGAGLPLFRGFYAVGVLAIVFGGFNIIASLIFRDRSSGITARHIRSKGNLATPPTKDGFDNYSSPAPDSYSQSHHSQDEEPRGYRRYTKRINWTRGVKKTDISGPLPPQIPSEEASIYDQSVYPRKGSYDEEAGLADLPRRPSSTLHPAHRRRDTHYSTAQMEQFPRY